MAKKTAPQQVSFEDALQQLEDIVSRMEHGELSLEESLAAFEQGVKLTRQCQSALKDAEQKVNMLVTEASKEDIVPANLDNKDSDE